MALKALLMRKSIDAKKKTLTALIAKRTELEERSAQLATAIEETETDEQRNEVEELVNQYETENAENEQAIGDLEREIEGLENDLAAEENAQNTEPPEGTTPPAEDEERKDDVKMINRSMNTELNLRDRLANIVTREDAKEFLSTVRTAISEKRAISNVGVVIPEVMLDLIRSEIAHASRLLPYVRLRSVSGEARQPITGSIPEGVWTECCANLNEVSLGFNQIEVDCYKVGGYIAVCNANLEDSDIALANEIVTALGGAIAKALDKAILFGTGTKMPIGIVTRLAQTSEPASWGALAPTWTDLHTSNVQTLNIDGSTGAAFFTSLIEKLAIAKPKGATGAPVWVMNRKTHLHIMAKALAFDSNAALVANTTLMPVIGGTVVEFEDDELQDNEIIGGFFDNYLLAERAGIKFASSDIPLFLQDQTVFKATARYDGRPVFGESFIVLNYANTSPTTSASFAEDTANQEPSA